MRLILSTPFSLLYKKQFFALQWFYFCLFLHESSFFSFTLTTLLLDDETIEARKYKSCANSKIIMNTFIFILKSIIMAEATIDLLLV